MSRIIDQDPLTGEWITFDYNHDNDTFVIGHWQDTEKIVESNKKALIEADHQGQSKNDWSHYAKIPNIVILEWQQKYGVDFFDRNHWPKVMSLINSPEYRDLKRTSYFHDR